jgi:disulfide bond formation protein DsbB
MSLGLPQWLAVDQWIPWLFGVQTTCGYTPIIAWNISMAESLMAMAVVLCLSASVMLFVALQRNR